MTAATLPDLSKLSTDQKLAMISDIWNSIVDDGSPLPVPEWLKEELRQQHEEYLRNPQRTTSWDEAEARILAQYAPAKNSA